jgi:L-alanine-DL-glutamate epimerase-like enolase superfamily enzyme
VPVRIERIEALRHDGHVFIRTVSTDGAEGVCLTNERDYLIPLMKDRLVPFFVGKDARDLETLVDVFPVYLSSTQRDITPERDAARFQARMAETGARAVKFKVGGRMSRNADESPGRTERIVPHLRKALGDDVTMYVDPNGSYDVEPWSSERFAVRNGKLVLPDGPGLGVTFDPDMLKKAECL